MDAASNEYTTGTPDIAGDRRVGEGVVVVNGRESHGTTTHPALVTRVWGKGAHPTINVKVFPDCGESYDSTSIQHWRKAPYGCEAWADIFEVI